MNTHVRIISLVDQIISDSPFIITTYARNRHIVMITHIHVNYSSYLCCVNHQYLHTYIKYITCLIYDIIRIKTKSNQYSNSSDTIPVTKFPKIVKNTTHVGAHPTRVHSATRQPFLMSGCSAAEYLVDGCVTHPSCATADSEVK